MRKASASGTWLFSAIPVFLGAAFVFDVYLRTAHLAHRPFLAACLLVFVVCAGAAFVLHTHVFMLFSFAIFTLPRFAPLLTGKPSHNLLFPAIAGLAVGLCAAGFYRGSRDNVSSHTDRVFRHYFPDAATLFALWIILLVVAGLTAYYTLHALPGLAFPGIPLPDREIASGVSANYGTYLLTHVAAGFLGPCLFLMAARRFPEGPRDVETRSSQLMSGTAAAAGFNFVVLFLQEGGVKRLLLGTADAGLSVMRLPGLLSDTGSAAVLLPPLVAAFILHIRRRFLLPDKPNVTSGTLVPTLLTLLLLAAALLVFLILSFREGRAFLIGSLVAAAFLTIVFAGDITRRVSVLHGLGRPYRIILAAIFIMLMAAPILILNSPRSPSFQALKRTFGTAEAAFADHGWFAAYQAMDQPRAKLSAAVWEIFLRHPLFGSGLGSFQVELAILRNEGWGLPSDNPPTLPGGLLAETGLAGTAIFLLVFLACGRRLWQARHNSQTLDVMALPLLTIPSFLVGYHFLFHEFTALWFFPLVGSLARSQASSAGSTPGQV